MTSALLSDVVLREQLAYIDRTLAHAARRRPLRQHPAWLLMSVGLAAGAALFAAGGVVVKMLAL